MNDVVAVRVFECVANLHGNRDDTREVCGTCLRETWAMDQFHYPFRKAAPVAHVVHRDDVWMIQCGGCARLAHETFASIGCLTGGGENFDGDFTSQLEIRGAKDCAPAAAADRGGGPVAFAKEGAGRGGSRRAEVIRKDARLLGVEHVLKDRTSHREAQKGLATKRPSGGKPLF